MEIIKLDHITKQYDDGFVALKDINLELESGKFYSLLGPSGSGKTTILRIIAGFTEASAGKVYFDGQDITNLDASKRHINTVFQNYALFPHLNVYENVAFALKLRRRSESEIREKVKDALHTVRLDGYANREISELSGGQQQRVAIAGRSSMNLRCCFWMNACQLWTSACEKKCSLNSGPSRRSWASPLFLSPTIRKKPWP